MTDQQKLAESLAQFSEALGRSRLETPMSVSIKLKKGASIKVKRYTDEYKKEAVKQVTENISNAIKKLIYYQQNMRKIIHQNIKK